MREVTQTEMLEFEKKKKVAKVSASSKKKKVSAQKGSGDAKLAKQSKQNPSNAKPTVKASTIYTPDAKKNTIISAARKTAALVGQSDKVTAASLGFKSTADIRNAATKAKSSSTTSSGNTTSKPSTTDRGILQSASNLVGGAKDIAEDIASPVINVASAALNPVKTMSRIISTGREALNVGRGDDSQSSNSWNIFGSSPVTDTTTQVQTVKPSIPDSVSIPSQRQQGEVLGMEPKKLIGGAVILGITGAYLFALRRSRRSYRW